MQDIWISMLKRASKSSSEISVLSTLCSSDESDLPQGRKLDTRRRTNERHVRLISNCSKYRNCLTDKPYSSLPVPDVGKRKR